MVELEKFNAVLLGLGIISFGFLIGSDYTTFMRQEIIFDYINSYDRKDLVLCGAETLLWGQLNDHSIDKEYLWNECL